MEYIFTFKEINNKNSKWYQFQEEDGTILNSVYHIILKRKKSTQYFTTDKVITKTVNFDLWGYRKILIKYRAKNYKINKHRYGNRIEYNQLYFKTQKEIEKAIEYLESYFILRELTK